MTNGSSYQQDDLQPDITQLMAQISDRFWILYYAADAENWDLAQYQLVCTRKLFRNATTVATEALATKLQRFIDDHLDSLEKAISAQDKEAFETAYDEAVKSANAYHRDIGVSFIEWMLPSEAPPHLRLDVSQ